MNRIIFTCTAVPTTTNYNNWVAANTDTTQNTVTESGGIYTVTLYVNSDVTTWSNALYNCPEILTLDFRECTSITTLAAGGFQRMENLEELYISAYMTTLNSHSWGNFDGDKNLYTLVIDSNNPTYDSRDNCNAVVETSTNTLKWACPGTTVPNTIVKLGYAAFISFKNSYLIVPNSVTIIDDSCFQNSGIKHLELGNNITRIGNGNWFGNKMEVIINTPTPPTYTDNSQYPNTIIYVPSQYLSVYESAWGNRLKIKSLPIPDNIIRYTLSPNSPALNSDWIKNYTDISRNTYDSSTGEGVFYLFSASTIGGGSGIIYSPFYNSTALLSIDLSDYIAPKIEEYAFYGCNNLTSVLFSNNIEFIGNQVFYGCSQLNSFTIPNSVLEIGEKAFYNTGWYGSQTNGVLYKDGWCLGYKGSAPSGTLNFNNNIKGIINNAFKNCTGLTSVIFSPSIEFIGKGAFYGCTGLTEVTLPENLTTINDEAFYRCTGLIGELVIPDNVTSIGKSAFYGCTGLTEVTLPENLTTINNEAFRACTNLTTVYWNSINIQYSGSNSIFQNCPISTVIFGNLVTNIPSYAFIGITTLSNITFSQNLTSIGQNAFSNCTGISQITLPENLTSIGQFAFSGCTSLTTIYWNSINISLGYEPFQNCPISTLIYGNSVTTIPNNFSGYTSLTSVTFGSSVTTISSLAFLNCTGLTNITFPNSITSIGQNAFQGCTNLLSVTCEATTPPTLGSNNFTASNDTLYVPSASVSAYQNNTNWRNAFTTIAGIYNLTTSVSGYGSISPSEGSLYEGDDVTLTITPVEGNGIFSVTDNGTSVPVTHTGMTYTISNIAADHTIAVVFKPYFEINIQVTEGGSLSFPDMAFAGEDFTITATPNEGFDVREFVVDGTDLGRSVYSYTFQAVDSNHSVEVVFSPIYNITVESTEGGTIEGPSIALGGDDVTFTITPDEGMLIFNVLDNDVPISVNPLGMTYTISDIQENHTIEVIFAIAKSYGFDLSNLTDDYIIQIYEEKKNL